MATALKYIVDGKGHKTSVLVPIKAWNQLNEDYQKLTKKLSILTGIQNGLGEVGEARKTGKSLQSLSDFLDEDSN